MRVLLRADAGRLQGTGHLMRCLTLAEALRSRGHSVDLMTAAIDVAWLAAVVDDSEMTVHRCLADSLAQETVDDLDPDWVVVDSYRIDPARISRLSEHRRVLAIVDRDARGAEATLYVDQNLGAELVERGHSLASRTLAGANYALVRNHVLAARRPEPWRLRSAVPRVLSFFGGSDPTRASTWVADEIAGIDLDFAFTVVAPEEQHKAIEEALRGRDGASVIGPTPELPALLAAADVVVAAAGTSAWDVCSLGIPAVLMAVVDNQAYSLRMAAERGLVIGIDATEGPLEPGAVAKGVASLLTDAALRERLSRNSLASFDGLGKERIADAMERRDEEQL